MFDIKIKCPKTILTVPNNAPKYVNSMESMFENCVTFNGDLSNWDVTNVKSTRAMFKNTPLFVGKGLGTWTTTSITDMGEMFMNSGIKE